MTIKDHTVNIKDLVRPLRAVLPVIDQVWKKILRYQAVITSGADGIHKAIYSRHYWGGAVDVRTWTDEDSGIQIDQHTRKLLVEFLKDKLGDQFNVYPHSTHIHIGYKPTKVNGNTTNINE